MSEATSRDDSGDSLELEALFDSVAAQRDAAKTTVPGSSQAPAVAPPATGADSDELEALFDSVASLSNRSAAAPEQPVPGDSEEPAAQERVFNRIGQMARQLHDTLRELGYDKLIAKTVEALPDTQDRLAYIANLTEQAACRVLNATDIAKPIQDELEGSARALAEKWDRLYANQLSVDDFKKLAADTRAFLKVDMPSKTSATSEQLLEIMMAQDFQDLTGQVIKKIISLAQSLETQLMQVLIEAMPGERRSESVNSLLNGPVIDTGRADVVASQQQVDDLLDSLGF